MDTELLAERFYYQALSVAPQIGEWPHAGPPSPAAFSKWGTVATWPAGHSRFGQVLRTLSLLVRHLWPRCPSRTLRRWEGLLRRRGQPGGGLCREEMVLRLAPAGTEPRGRGGARVGLGTGKPGRVEGPCGSVSLVRPAATEGPAPSEAGRAGRADRRQSARGPLGQRCHQQTQLSSPRVLRCRALGGRGGSRLSDISLPRNAIQPAGHPGGQQVLQRGGHVLLPALVSPSPPPAGALPLVFTQPPGCLGAGAAKMALHCRTRSTGRRVGEGDASDRAGGTSLREPRQGPRSCRAPASRGDGGGGLGAGLTAGRLAASPICRSALRIGRPKLTSVRSLSHCHQVHARLGGPPCRR